MLLLLFIVLMGQKSYQFSLQLAFRFLTFMFFSILLLMSNPGANWHLFLRAAFESLPTNGFQQRLFLLLRSQVTLLQRSFHQVFVVYSGKWRGRQHHHHHRPWCHRGWFHLLVLSLLFGVPDIKPVYSSFSSSASSSLPYLSPRNTF